jgi:uncharacterized protein
MDQESYSVSQDFRAFASRAGKTLHLDRFSGEWFVAPANEDSWIGSLHRGIRLNDLDAFDSARRDLTFSLLEAGVLQPSPAGKPSRAPSPQRHQVTLVIIEALNYCNLACSYCFEDVPQRGVKMTANTAVKIVSSIEKLNLAPDITIEFNGGESFANIDLLERFVSAIRDSEVLRRRRVSFGVTTNLTVLTPRVMRFIKDNWVSVSVSLDGPADDHDRHRFFGNGSGSHARVVRNIARLREEGIRFNTISVITGALQLTRCYEFLKELRVANASFAIRRHSDRLPLEDADYREIADAQYAAFRDSFACFSQQLYAPILVDYAIMIRNIIRPFDPDYMCLRTPCGAGLNMITYDTAGDIYACQDLIKEPAFRICSASDPNPQQLLDESPLVQQLRARIPGGNKGCEDCNFQMFCQGGCYSTSYFESGKDIAASFQQRTPHCEYFYRTFSRLLPDFVSDARGLLKYAYSNQHFS